ncbi:MAG: DNA polymerase III subunit alpha [Treponema sp.]|uniref:DNA polymerase III subunit alpha n=1 Tax=Treponema sp. TaxID=166 RepID=UPI00298DEB49|nr:DNA polymerase III subunit alpha [Treponema sp.]MBR5932730.1 DNA polymerase III subunit alpha [Treponema sp.]
MCLVTYDCPEGTPESKYIPLDVMSDYSIGESIARIPALVEKAKSLNMKVLALTDRTLAGAIEFYLLCKENEIKPIIGQKIALGNNEVNLLCKDFESYKILCRHSLEFQEANEFPMSVTELPLSKEECSHFICISPYCDSELSAAFGDNLYKQVDFGDVKSHTDKLENLDTSNSVITNSVRYIEKDDFEALAAFKQSLSDNPPETFTDNYFVDDSEIIPLLSDKNLLELADNTQYIADQIQFIFPEEYFLTLEIHNRVRESLPDFEDSENQLRSLVQEGFKQKQNEFENEEEARERLTYELNNIIERHWEKIFLFQHELTSWCRQTGIEYGPGRGSAPGSLVSYLLGITNVNPLKYGLLYERFLNPIRLCYPDFDIDYDYERLPEVVNHLKDKYGDDRVVRIAAYGRLECCSALEIAANYLNYPEEEVQPLIKIIKDTCYLRMDFSKLLDSNSHIYRDLISHWDGVKLQGFLRDKKNEKLVRIAKSLEWIKRNFNLHSSGYIITKKPARNYCPVLKDGESGWLYYEYAMDSLEYAGLYKNDILGLRELTKLNQLSREIEKKVGKNFDYKEIILEDKETIETFSKGKNTDVFQFESPGIKKVLKEFIPEKFSDLVLINAMYRPGPMDYLPTVIENKQNGNYGNDFPGCEAILEESYGSPVYQEQVIQLSHTLAGYTLAEGEMFRRVVGKKKPDVLIARKKEFIKRAVEKDLVTENQAIDIFEIIVPFAGYAFIKSHSVAYTMMAYWEMYMKVHYPKEYRKVIKNFKDY